jgi:hypothetical protein
MEGESKEKQDLEKQDLEKQDLEKQDLVNPARKTAFEKSRAKNNSENNEEDDKEEQDLENPERKTQDLENPARKSTENNEEDDKEEQDLENPARKTAFEKSRAKNNSENDKEDKEEDNNIDSVDIDYNIDYLIEDDEKLINVDNVKSQVDTYISNYNGEIMKKYRIAFNRLYQKYSNKKYTIKILPVNDKYKSTKIVVVKNGKKEDKENDIVTELIKPHYIYYNDEDFNLYHFKNKISNTRAELLYKYELLVSKINITPEEKTNFEKERNKFIKLLEDYYSYTLYHKKINKIAILNTTPLILQSKYNIHNDNNDNETISSILSGDTYVINNNIINLINNNNIDKLTQYNNIVLQLTGKNNKEIKKDTKLMEEIKLYLNKNEKENLIKQIEESKTHQDNYINYIVSRLPNV